MTLFRLLSLAALLGGGAAAAIDGTSEPARAAAAIDRLSYDAVKGRRLDVTLDTSLAARGVVTVEGTVAGRRISVRKRVRPGTRSLKLKLDAKRAKIRNLEVPLVFDLEARVTESGSATDAVRSFQAVIPVPLIVLPGYGNEQTPGGFDAFATALDLSAAGAYGFGTETSRLVVHEYDSAAGTLADAARPLDKIAAKLLRGSVFRKVDVVGYSMGGLVARQWLAERGEGRVRKMVFLATPNEGAPIAYIGVTAAKAGALGGLTGTLPVDIGPILDGFLTPELQESLRIFYPTYPWATVELFPGFPIAVPNDTLPDASTPLAALNGIGPDPDAEFHAIFYTSVPTEVVGVPIGTVDEVDVTPLLAGLGGGGFDFTNVDFAALASGDGDGIVPARSTRMDDTSGWSSVMIAHDMGAGTHVTAPGDPAVLAEIVEIVAR